MSRMFEPGAALSPSGHVVMGSDGRRAEILYAKRQKGHCTWCDAAVKSPRRWWCSQPCVDAMTALDWNTIRRRVIERDRKGPCVLCGETLIPAEKRDRYDRPMWQPAEIDVDHIEPIIEGGHPFDLANLRAVHRECHKAETRALAARRAEARQAEREAEDPQAGLFGGDA